jgi:hypothetical protein
MTISIEKNIPYPWMRSLMNEVIPLFYTAREIEAMLSISTSTLWRLGSGETE